MRHELWPDETEADRGEWLARDDATVLVAPRDSGGLRGFAEIGSRSIAEGCLTSPVAYLEGWYVDPDSRRQRVGASLILAAEQWARGRGFQELASDTQLANLVAQRAHERLGFIEVERAVLYVKRLTWNI
jgi:aminoglycoside 6'-N-acetyltransferase I